LSLVLLLLTLIAPLPILSFTTPPNLSKNRHSVSFTPSITHLKLNGESSGNNNNNNGIRFPPRGGGGGGGGDNEGSQGGNSNSDGMDLIPPFVLLYKQYQSLLSRSPLVTKSITAGIITLIGDLIAQYLESRLEGNTQWNLTRMSAFTIAGCCYVGPFVHYWYEILWYVGRKLPPSFPSSFTTLIQVLLDQTIGVAAFFPAYFYVYESCESIAGLRKANYGGVGIKIKRDLGGILVNQYKVWPIINFVSFSMVPEQLRVLFSNVASVFWNIYLCSQVGT